MVKFVEVIGGLGGVCICPEWCQGDCGALFASQVRYAGGGGQGEIFGASFVWGIALNCNGKRLNLYCSGIQIYLSCTQQDFVGR
jgi:hypothetical protein